MNVFEFLGLDAEHRTHPFQLVKHRDEVPESKLKFPVYGQIKRDGVFCAVVVYNGKAGVFGRTGKELINTEAVANRYKDAPVGLYLGELQTMALAHLEALSGVVNPNRVNELDFQGEQIKENLYVDFFDMLTIKAFIEGKTNITFLKRYDALHKRLDGILSGEDCILSLEPCNNEDDVQKFSDYQIRQGREGAVFKHDDDYESGHKGYRQTKIVRTISYDLTCIGWEEGKGKYKGKVANLIFKWKDGKTVKAMLGKGWSHDDATKMYNDIKLGGSLMPIGRIFAVKALQESSKGVLRLPKVSELRHDKEIADV